MVYNDGDQLVRWPGMYRYSYDGAGNLVQVRNDSQTQVLKSYTYSPAGLLATATIRDKDGNTRTLSNTWDADSNRVGMNANGTAYAFVYDPTAGIPAVIEESTSGSTAYYIREPGGSLIARLNATEGIRYYHVDELGSTRLLTDGSGNVTDKYAYDAYGSLLSHDAYAGSVQQPYGYVGQLGYYTHYQEPEFGLLQLGVRFYDPEVGRFGQRDPLQHTASSPYPYVEGQVLRRADPSGRLGIQIAVGVIALGLYLDAKCIERAFDAGDAYRGPDNAIGHVSHYMAHCMASCLITRCVPQVRLPCSVGLLLGTFGINARTLFGTFQALLGGLLIEILQATPLLRDPPGWGNDYWIENMAWNFAGAQCGIGGGTCFQCCSKKAKQANQF
jgi:RHS repeat-associated protein